MIPNRWGGAILAALTLVALTGAPVGAQSAGGGTGRTVAPRARQAGTSDDPAVLRELERQQAERMQLVAHIESLVAQLGRDAQLSRSEQRRLQGELETSMRRLTEAHARVGVDVGTRIMLQRRPSVATGEMRRLVGEAQRRLSSAARTGYVGITLSPTTNRVRPLGDGKLYVRYFDYPSILSVDPGSPAERAGLRRGDVVLAYNSMDVRRELPMHELLEPGHPVRIRISRDGDEREVGVMVAAAPAAVLGRREELFAPTPAPAPVGRVIPRASRAPEALATTTGFELVHGVAGAELSAITRGLGAALGVRRGLLVMSVAPNSPAARAGLRDGDVILQAAGRAVSDIPALSRVMREHEQDREVKLQVRRERRNRTIRLSW